MKNTVVLFAIIFLSGCGGRDPLRLDNQINNKCEYEKIFLNSPNCITILTKNDDGALVAVEINDSSEQPIQFLSSDKKYITWNSYDAHNYRHGKYDVKVYLPEKTKSSIDPEETWIEIKGGVKDKGKFGKEKLEEIH